MPTYDYQCDSCGATWELFQKITDDPIKKCPECGKKKARRLFGTGAAIMFKGSGFYETDYRSESYKKSAEADKKDSSGSSDSKSDSANKSESNSAGKNSNKSEKPSGGETKSSKPKKTGND